MCWAWGPWHNGKKILQCEGDSLICMSISKIWPAAQMEIGVYFYSALVMMEIVTNAHWNNPDPWIFGLRRRRRFIYSCSSRSVLEEAITNEHSNILMAKLGLRHWQRWCLFAYSAYVMRCAQLDSFMVIKTDDNKDVKAIVVANHNHSMWGEERGQTRVTSHWFDSDLFPLFLTS